MLGYGAMCWGNGTPVGWGYRKRALSCANSTMICGLKAARGGAINSASIRSLPEPSEYFTGLDLKRTAELDELPDIDAALPPFHATDERLVFAVRFTKVHLRHPKLVAPGDEAIDDRDVTVFECGFARLGHGRAPIKGKNRIVQNSLFAAIWASANQGGSYAK